MKTTADILKAIAAIDDDLQELSDATPHDAPGHLSKRIRQACECLYDAMNELTDYPLQKMRGLEDEIESFSNILRLREGIEKWAKKDLRKK